MLQAYGVTAKGRIRPTNEDYFAIDERLRLCVLADGMGGHNAGEVAARMAVQTVVDFIVRRTAANATGEMWPFGFDASLSKSGNLLRTAIQLANVHIHRTSAATHQYAGMGTTVVAALIDGDRLSVGHVGDSRLYVVGKDGLRQLTRDDSWIATMLARNPAADRASLQRHPMRNALTSVVGARSCLDVHVIEETLTGGEVLLLLTDGVHSVLEPADLGRLLREPGDPRRIATNLVETALAEGSGDNCTAVVARHAPVPEDGRQLYQPTNL